MDRAERTGLGVAVLAHVALFGMLSLNLIKPPALPKLEADPIEVTLSDEVALTSTAPELSSTPPAPASEPAPPEPAPMPLPRAEPTPPPRPAVQPKPAPRAAAKPVAKPAPRKPGLSRDILSGLNDAPSRETPSRSSGAPARAIGPAVASSIGAEVRRQLKPHWKSPTGADVELLRTTLSVRLNRDGSLAGSPELVSQSGVNASNRAQAKLHVDQAVKAVRLAAPFKLPAEYFDAWREIRPTFDRRL